MDLVAYLGGLMPVHCFVPDCQCKPGVPIEHLSWCGQYIAEKKPDVIICGGDFADMESLSSYDVGKKSFEGRRYANDIKAAHEAMRAFLEPINREINRLITNKKKAWHPRFVLTLGNHENRINRAINDDSKLDGLLSVDDLKYKEFGWEVIPFLDVITIDGIAYSHYFCSGVMGRPITSAKALLTKKHMSCVAAHQQGRDIAYGQRADGTRMTTIISGSFYQHEEDFLNAQTNNHWHGVWLFHEVKNGAFDEMPVSLEYLRQRYGK